MSVVFVVIYKDDRYRDHNGLTNLKFGNRNFFVEISISIKKKRKTVSSDVLC